MTELSPILMRVTATAFAISYAITMPDIAHGQNKNIQSKAPPAASLIQKLRSFLGLNPPVAVGGSRSDNEKMVCLVRSKHTSAYGIRAIKRDAYRKR